MILQQSIGERLIRYASGLRFPKLLALTSLLFVVDLLVPDLLPFADEIFLGLVSLLLTSLRKRNGSSPPPKRPA